MNKSYVFYTEVLAEDNLMQCIYFVKGECRAHPFAQKAKVGDMESVGGEDIDYYKPTEEDQKYCRNLGPDDFTFCPRYRAYLDYLKALGLAK